MQEQVAIIEDQKREQLAHEDAALAVTLADLAEHAALPLDLTANKQQKEEVEKGLSNKKVLHNPVVPLDVLSEEDNRDLDQKVMVFKSKGARQFMEDEAVWGANAPLGQLKVNAVITDIPYGVNRKDGTSSDKEIPDEDAAIICKRYYERLQEDGSVLIRCHEDQVPKWSLFFSPLLSLPSHPLICRKQFLLDAGFWVDRYSTRTVKQANTQNWMPPKAVREHRRGPQGVGYNYVVAHKVSRHLRCLDYLFLTHPVCRSPCSSSTV